MSDVHFQHIVVFFSPGLFSRLGSLVIIFCMSPSPLQPAPSPMICLSL